MFVFFFFCIHHNISAVLSSGLLLSFFLFFLSLSLNDSFFVFSSCIFIFLGVPVQEYQFVFIESIEHKYIHDKQVVLSFSLELFITTFLILKHWVTKRSHTHTIYLSIYLSQFISAIYCICFLMRNRAQFDKYARLYLCLALEI